MSNSVKEQAAEMARSLLEQPEGDMPPAAAAPAAAAAAAPAGRYSGPTLGMLRKYHLADASGNIRMVKLEGDREPGPIIDPEALDRLLALDPSSSKKTLDWILYAAGGGTPKLRESERALELAKNWVIDNRMKGKGREEEEIKPMTRQEAEADWQTNDYQRYHDEYFFADQDLASDPQYPVFGYYREWPGRDNVYQKIEEGVKKWTAILQDKKLLSQYNKLNPDDPFQVSLWDMGKPRFATVEELLTTVQQFKASFARRKAEKNVQFIGKSPEGKFTRGPNEVLYKDQLMTVYIPATAAASMKTGFPNWCVSNKSRWEEYFRTRSKESLMWGTYNARGPFVFWHFNNVQDPMLKRLAGHIQLSCRVNQRGGGGAFVQGIQFWDGHNQQSIAYNDIVSRLRGEPNGTALVNGFNTSIKEAEAWFAQFNEESDIEQYPALEDLARKLVASLLD